MAPFAASPRQQLLEGLALVEEIEARKSSTAKQQAHLTDLRR